MSTKIPSKAEITKELESKKSWKVSEAIGLIDTKLGAEASKTFFQLYKQYTDDPTSSFYNSEVFVEFLNDMDEDMFRSEDYKKHYEVIRDLKQQLANLNNNVRIVTGSSDSTQGLSVEAKINGTLGYDMNAQFSDYELEKMILNALNSKITELEVELSQIENSEIPIPDFITLVEDLGNTWKSMYQDFSENNDLSTDTFGLSKWDISLLKNLFDSLGKIPDIKSLKPLVSVKELIDDIHHEFVTNGNYYVTTVSLQKERIRELNLLFSNIKVNQADLVKRKTNKKNTSNKINKSNTDLT